MAGFRDRPFSARIGAMGDQAEQIFERVYDHGWVRFGLNRPPIAVHRLPKQLRYSPDYLTTHGFLEVQGFGRDQQFKLKMDKAWALQWWNELHPVDLFAYDSKNDRFGFAPLADVLDVAQSSPVKQFREGNQYWSIRSDDLPVRKWVAVQ